MGWMGGCMGTLAGQEATQVATNFFSLSTTQQQDVLNFLRSL